MTNSGVPPVLFKYTSASVATLVLQTGKLRWSSPTLFNDVAEFQRMPRFEPTLAKAHQLLPAILADAVLGVMSLDESRLGPPMQLVLQIARYWASLGFTREQLIDRLHTERTDADELAEQSLLKWVDDLNLNLVRVLCLTETYDNEVMWGTYAASHAGCVIGFTHLPELSTPFLAARKVKYSELAPVIGSGLDFLLYGDTSDLRTKTLDAICFTKKSSWSYEAEWRAMSRRERDKEETYCDYKFYPKELESVTLGARTSSLVREEIRAIIKEKYPNASLYEMAVERGQLQRIRVGDA